MAHLFYRIIQSNVLRLVKKRRKQNQVIIMAMQARLKANGGVLETKSSSIIKPSWELKTASSKEDEREDRKKKERRSTSTGNGKSRSLAGGGGDQRRSSRRSEASGKKKSSRQSAGKGGNIAEKVGTVSTMPTLAESPLPLPPPRESSYGGNVEDSLSSKAQTSARRP